MGLLLQVHLTGDRDQDYRVHLVLAHQLPIHEILGFPPLVDLQMMTDQCGSNLQGRRHLSGFEIYLEGSSGVWGIQGGCEGHQDA